MTTIKDDSLIGFYASLNSGEDEQELVKKYLWGDNGLKEKLKTLKWFDYGQDFHLILFQFYVRPIPYLRENLREIENYRAKEKSIGIPMIIDEDNFFRHNTADKDLFLKQTMLDKLDLLKPKLKRNELDLDIERLKCDIEKLLS